MTPEPILRARREADRMRDLTPLIHAYCDICLVIHGGEAPPMCGQTRNAITNLSEGWPADLPRCVVCIDLAPQACERCGS